MNKQCLQTPPDKYPLNQEFTQAIKEAKLLLAKLEEAGSSYSLCQYIWSSLL